MIDQTLIPPAIGIVGLIVAFVIYGIVKSYDEGPDALKKIADQIHIGAMVFMRREYTLLALFSAALLVLIMITDLGIYTAAAFVAGGLSSAGCRLDRHVCRHQSQRAHDQLQRIPKANQKRYR